MIYFVHVEDELVYIGLTIDLDGRLHSHGDRWPNALITTATIQQLVDMYDLSVDMGLEEIEGLMIALHNPADNKRGPDLVASYPWPPTVREESPRRIRAKSIIAQLRSYKHES